MSALDGLRDLARERGDPSRGLRLLDWRLEQGRFVATVEGSGEQRFRVRSQLDLRVVEGGRLESRAESFLTVAVSLGSGGSTPASYPGPVRHRTRPLKLPGPPAALARDHISHLSFVNHR